VGFWDWVGPTSLTKRRAVGWDALPPVPERKASWTIDDQRAIVVPTLTHGPGTYGTDSIGDGNSAVYACLQVIATALSEPPLRVYREANGDRNELPDTPLGELLAHPNPHMPLSALLEYLSNCLHIDGNGYWRKLRAGNPETGNVVELWPISPSLLTAVTIKGSTDFISYYRYYMRPGVYEDIAPQNVVHFRKGLRDGDHRYGDGPIKRLAREVSSDEQATRYADRLLGKLAIPGLYASFDKEAPSLTQAQAEELKARLQALYGGENVGSVGIGSPGMTIGQLGFSPEQMDMKTLHRVPEERIAAVLGVPAIVAGLGAGLDRSTYSNFAEAREAFTEMKMMPTWRQLGDVLTMSLVPDFASDRNVSIAFMIDDVRALQDDQNALATRLKTYVESGILTVDEARAEIGHEPLPEAEPEPVAAFPPVDPEQRSWPRILTLPMSRKALDDLPGSYDRMRADREPDWESALRTFLASQLRRANAKLRSGADTGLDLIVEGEAALLGETLLPLQRAVLSDVHGLVVSELGITFQIDDAATRAYLRSAGANIVNITETTRAAVQAELTAGQAAGEGIPQLAARLRQLPAFGEGRAVTVARTELGHSQNTAALATYQASGLVYGVTVFDGDYDSECAAMHGRKFPLNQAPPTLQHPRCRRAFAPIVDASELHRSA
jgi:HK97 family phage portal protein